MKSLEEIYRDLLDDEDFILDESINTDNFGKWDSLFHINLMAAIEDEFGVKFMVDDINRLHGVKEILDELCK